MLAERSRQPLRDLLGWHPRDVDTLEQLYHDRAEQAEQQDREERFAAGTAQVFRQMHGR